jgi:hypothetical protein
MLILKRTRRKSIGSSNGEKGVRNQLCEAPGGPVPGKWFLTPFSRRRVLTSSSPLWLRPAPLFAGLASAGWRPPRP